MSFFGGDQITFAQPWLLLLLLYLVRYGSGLRLSTRR